MNKRYNSIDKFDFKGRSSSIKNILHLGGEHIILGPKFDIKKYFNEIGKQKLNENSPKKTNINKLSLLYPTFSPKNKKLYNISTSNYKSQNFHTLENESNSNRRSEYIFNTNHSSKNIYNNNLIKNNTFGNNKENCFLTSLDIEQNKNNFKTIDARDYIISFNSNHCRNKKLFKNDNKGNKIFHISDIVKEIKEKYKTKNELDIKNDYIAYNKQNIESVLNANKIINHYQEKNEWDLKVNDVNFHNFISNNKNIYKHNILKILVNKEREKLIENEKIIEKDVKEKHDMISNDEKEFEQIVLELKQYNKAIEDCRIEIEKTNKDLYYLKSLMSYKVQNKEAEIMKKLFEMEELRHYAKFVNNMLEKDTSIFEIEIFPMDYEKKIELNALVQNTFKVYENFINDDKNENQNNGNEPEIIYKEFLGLQDKIRYIIKEKERQYEERKKTKLNNKLILDEIINKKNFLETEYNNLKKEYETTKTIISQKENFENFMVALAKELFIYLLEIFSDENLKKYRDAKLNEVSGLLKLADLAEKSKNCISEKEIFINKSIRNIEIIEENNPRLFVEILDMAKERIILQRQKEAKELRIFREKLKKIQAMKKLEKINFIIRRVERPFHIKKNKEIKIDLINLKEKEDKELITYQ